MDWRRGVLALSALLAACSPASSRTPGELRVNLESEPPTLDWTLATDGTSIHVIEQLMRGLTQLGPALQPEPALAERWEVSEDGQTYTFHLRRDVVWSDGVPLHADQFVYAWQRLLRPETAAEYAYFLYPVVNARALNQGEIEDPDLLGVRALDAHTLEVQIEEPLIYFPSLTMFMITYPVRRDLIEQFGEGWTEPGRIQTLGPYVLDEWRHEYRLTLRRNPRYFGTPPPTERIVAYMVEERSTGLVLFEQGLLDIVKLPPLEVRSYRDEPTYHTLAQLRGDYYGFNTSKPPFNDARVRRAFSMAVDRSEFPRLLQAGQVATGSWIPASMPFSNTSIGLDFDPQTALQLLREAEFDFDQVIELVYNSLEQHKLVAENVQAQWQRNLGVNVELQNREWKVFLREVTTDPPQIFRLGWGADYPDPHNFMNLFTSSSANNNTRWANAEYDELVAEAARESEPGRRQRLYDRAQRILCEIDAPIAPLYAESINRAIHPHVRGYEINAMDLPIYDHVSVELPGSRQP